MLVFLKGQRTRKYRCREHEDYSEKGTIPLDREGASNENKLGGKRGQNSIKKPETTQCFDP